MQFNEFQKELQNRGIDPQNAYMFTLIYERLIQTEKLVMDAMNVLEVLANSVSGVAQLHEATQTKLKQVLRGGMPDGVDVASVAYDPDENKH